MKLLGFAIAGGAMMLVAEVSPQVAVGTMALVLLGAIVTNPTQLNALSSIVSGTYNFTTSSSSSSSSSSSTGGTTPPATGMA